MSIYVPYSRRELINEPRVVFLGRYRVEFKAFGLAEYMYCTPVVVLAGDFQKFSYYREFVVTLQKHRPVVIVSLPSLGSNDQRVADLSQDEVAEVLRLFLEHFDFPPVSLVSLSLESSVASRFGCLYPDRVERLLLAGVIGKPRRSFCSALEALVKDLADCEPYFAEALILQLFHPRDWRGEGVFSDEESVGGSYRKLLGKQIRQLSDLQKGCYEDNLLRIVSGCQREAVPQIKTLVLAGEYDYFTLPFEGAAYARSCVDGQFAVVENASHLILYEAPNTVLECIVRFLEGRSLEGVPGLVVGEAALAMLPDKRAGPRVALKKPNVWLSSGSGEVRQKVLVEAINYRGGVLVVPANGIKRFDQKETLELDFLGMGKKLKVIVFEGDGNQVKFLFKHVDTAEAGAFMRGLANPEFFESAEQESYGAGDYCTGEESLAN